VKSQSVKQSVNVKYKDIQRDAKLRYEFLVCDQQSMKRCRALTRLARTFSLRISAGFEREETAMFRRRIPGAVQWKKERGRVESQHRANDHAQKLTHPPKVENPNPSKMARIMLRTANTHKPNTPA
jgi:hypothetical protein